MTRKVVNFILTTILLTQHASYAASNSIAKDILSPNSMAYDFTYDASSGPVTMNKTFIEIEKIVKEVEKITDAFMPRDIEVGNCVGKGCPIDTVQCDAVHESPLCPNGTLNPITNMCEAEPIITVCPGGYTVDKTNNICYRDIVCPGGGIFNPSKDRCELATEYSCNSPVSIASAGLAFTDAKEHYIKYATNTIATSRGWNVAVFDKNWDFVESRQFDTHANISNANAMRDYINSIRVDNHVALSTWDEPSANVATNTSLKTALKTLGVTDSLISGLGYRSAYAFLGVKASVAGVKIAEQYAPNASQTIYLNNYADGYTKIQESGKYLCVKNISCGIGVYVPERQRCENSPSYDCKGGLEFVYDHNSSSQSTPRCIQKSTLLNCPTGLDLNTSRGDFDRCEKPISSDNCPSGYLWDKTLDHCVKSVECPDGGVLNPTLNRCEIAMTTSNTCPSGGNWEILASSNICIIPKTKLSAQCDAGGVYYTTLTVLGTVYTVKKCLIEQTGSEYCKDAGYNPDYTYDKCLAIPACSGADLGYSGTYRRCTQTATNTCPTSGISGYTYSYNATSMKCEMAPWCDTANGFAFNTERKRCEKTVTSAQCPSGKDSQNRNFAYSFNGNYCEAIPYCPYGGEFVGGSTDKCRIVPGKTCPIGWRQSGNTCYLDNVCPDGGYHVSWNQYFGSCYLYKTLSEFCGGKDGYIIAPDKSRCYKTYNPINTSDVEAACGNPNNDTNLLLETTNNRCVYTASASSITCDTAHGYYPSSVYAANGTAQCVKMKNTDWMSGSSLSEGVTKSIELNASTNCPVFDPSKTVTIETGVIDKCTAEATPKSVCPVGHERGAADGNVLECQQVVTTANNCPLNTQYNPVTNRCDQDACEGTGGYWYGGKCVIATGDLHTCPDGTRFDLLSQKCIYEATTHVGSIDNLSTGWTLTPPTVWEYNTVGMTVPSDTYGWIYVGRTNAHYGDTSCVASAATIDVIFGYSFSPPSNYRVLYKNEEGNYVPTTLPVGYNWAISITDDFRYTDGTLLRFILEPIVWSQTLQHYGKGTKWGNNAYSPQTYDEYLARPFREKTYYVVEYIPAGTTISNLVAYGTPNKCNYAQYYVGIQTTASPAVKGTCNGVILQAPALSRGYGTANIYGGIEYPTLTYIPASASPGGLDPSSEYVFAFVGTSPTSTYSVNTLSSGSSSYNYVKTSGWSNFLRLNTVNATSNSYSTSGVFKTKTDHVITDASGQIPLYVPSNTTDSITSAYFQAYEVIAYKYKNQQGQVCWSSTEEAYNFLKGQTPNTTSKFFEPICPSGQTFYNGVCAHLVEPTCGSLSSDGAGKCFVNPSCDGSVFSNISTEKDKCWVAAPPSGCPSGYELGSVDGVVTQCQKVVSTAENCSQGIYNPTTNKCEFISTVLNGKEVCASNTSLTAQFSGSAYCSMTGIVPGSVKFKSLSMSDYEGGTVCGIATDNKAYCWGANSEGQSGDGTKVSKSTPTLVSGGKTWLQVTVADGFACGIASDNKAYCWGSNWNRQLGDGTTTQRTVPTLVSGGKTWLQITAGTAHTCGIASDNKTYCWGSNAYGQLGDGTKKYKTVPTLESGGKTWLQITAGTFHTCGIASDNKAYCWGSGTAIGDGTTTQRTVPTLVSGGKTWSQIEAKQDSTCGIANDNKTYCWGYNHVGQLGDGTTTQRTVPTLVSGGKTWTKLFRSSTYSNFARTNELVNYKIGTTLDNSFSENMNFFTLENSNIGFCGIIAEQSNCATIQASPNCNTTIFGDVNTTIDKCWIAPPGDCDAYSGWSLDSTTNKCVSSIKCTDTSSSIASYDVVNNACSYAPSVGSVTCDTSKGYTQLSNTSKCVKTPSCPTDTYNGQYWNTTSHECRVPYTNPCGANYNTDTWADRCTRAWSCGNPVDTQGNPVPVTSSYPANQCTTATVNSCNNTSVYPTLSDNYCWSAGVPDVDGIDFADACPSGTYDALADKCKSTTGASICTNLGTAFDSANTTCYKNGNCGIPDPTGSSITTNGKCEQNSTTSCSLAGYVADWSTTKSTIANTGGNKNICYQTAIPTCQGTASERYFDANVSVGRCVENILGDCGNGYVWDKDLLKCKKDPTCSPGTFDSTNERCTMAIDCNSSNYTETDNANDKCYNQYGVPDNVSTQGYDSCTNGAYSSAYKKCDGGNNVCSHLAGAQLDTIEDKCWKNINCGTNDSSTNPSLFEPDNNHFWNKLTNRCESGAVVNCQGGIGYNPKTGVLESCSVSQGSWCKPWAYEYKYEGDMSTLEKCVSVAPCDSGIYNPLKNRCEYETTESNCRTDLNYILDNQAHTCFITDNSELSSVCRNPQNVTSVNSSYDIHLNTQKDYNSSAMIQGLVYSELYNRCQTGYDSITNRNIISNVCPTTNSQIAYLSNTCNTTSGNGTTGITVCEPTGLSVGIYYFTQTRSGENPYTNVSYNLKNKCEIVPICVNGMYNPINNQCFMGDLNCPIGPYECIGPKDGDKWCSPYKCNPNSSQCGWAECPGNITPSTSAEMNPSLDLRIKYTATDPLCMDGRCDIFETSRFTYCGMEDACPSGFGIYEEAGKCFVKDCPQGSYQENNKCYSLGCPKGTTEQGDGTCLVN